MGKRRRSSSADSSSDSYTSRLRPKDGLRKPDRLVYGNQEERDACNATAKNEGRKKDVKRIKCPPPPLDLYSANRFTWRRRPKFLEYSGFVPMDGLSGINDAGGDARPSGSATSGCSSSDSVASTSALFFAQAPKSKRMPMRNDYDASIYRQLQDETRSIIARMFMESAPSDVGIPSWFWGHLRPCDRFLLLKRLFVVDLVPMDAAVINSIDSPDFSDAKKVIKNLSQLHIVISPDAAQTNAMRIPNICARLFEVHDKILHPRRSRRLQDARNFSVTVEKRNHGRLNIYISGESFILKLWTDDKDFTRFIGHYQREVFPRVRAAFRAVACMEGPLERDEDYLGSKKISIRQSFDEIA